MSHYQEIVNVYKATQNLWNAVNTITSIPKEGYSALVSIYTNGKKLMWNAYKYGITTKVSAAYKKNIENLADNFAAAVYKNPEISSVAASPMYELRNALTNYVPADIKKPKPVETSKPEIKPEPKKENLPGAANTGREIPKAKVEIGEIENKTPTQTANLTPEQTIKSILGRDVVTFYVISQAKYELDKDTYNKAGYTYVPTLGLVPHNQINIAKKILTEKWIKDSRFGYVSRQEYDKLKGAGYI